MNTDLKFNHKHPTHKETLLKFVALVVLLVSYFFYMSWKYDASTGLGLLLLTWSFFVLCTPIADGGFIIAFPVRLLFGIKMVYTQIATWFIAAGINIVMLLTNPETYDLTFLTQLFRHILVEPYPYWSIIAISALGTFLSIFFGDEMLDVATHQEKTLHHRHGLKYRSILIVGFGILTLIAYYYLLDSLNIVMPQ